MKVIQETKFDVFVFRNVETRYHQYHSKSEGRAAIPVIMYFNIIKSVFDITLTDNYQYQSQFVDTDDIIR